MGAVKMTSQKRKAFSMGIRTSVFHIGFFFILLFFFCCSSSGVTSKIIRHNSSGDFLKGKIENIVIGSKGTLQLGRAWEKPVEEFEGVWSINSIVFSGGDVFMGTSPNGGIYKYSLGELNKIYPLESENTPEEPGEEGLEGEAEAEQQEDSNDADKLEQQEHLKNEHIFAMTRDVAGRLLAGISGENCRLIRFGDSEPEILYEPNDAKYIFAIATDTRGNIYLGTGPEGKVYRYDPFDSASTGLVYDSRDKNILSLAIDEQGFVYAGSDERGLVYKIEPQNKAAEVLYDSPQPEVTSLVFGSDGYLYAAATSAEIKQSETSFAATMPFAGKPEVKTEEGNSGSDNNSGHTLLIPTTSGGGSGNSNQGKAPVHKPSKPSKASYIYRISRQGYVNEVFSEAAVFFSVTLQAGNLLIGTGNSGQLFKVDPATERESILYEDQSASQITVVAVSGEDVYLGTANPAKLIRLKKSFSPEGTYRSTLVDASQPAKWGKLQIEADIPDGTEIMLSSRSGNVQDVNDPTFADWTEPVKVTGPVQLRCPLGRFCQYKLIIKSVDGTCSPIVREVAIASTVPNLKPKIKSVTAERQQGPGKEGQFQISYEAEDDNGDKLIYKIDFRKLGRENWIEVTDEFEEDKFVWDGKTVEDGRYEIRVTASDVRSNKPVDKKTVSRVSDPIIVDNTGPEIEKEGLQHSSKRVTLKLRVSDKYSAIGEVHYTVDSSEDWKKAMPDDFVYDTMAEDFTIVIEELQAGEHIIAVKASDQAGNTTYKSFEIVIESD